MEKNLKFEVKQQTFRNTLTEVDEFKCETITVAFRAERPRKDALVVITP